MHFASLRGGTFLFFFPDIPGRKHAGNWKQISELSLVQRVPWLGPSLFLDQKPTGAWSAFLTLCNLHLSL